MENDSVALDVLAELSGLERARLEPDMDLIADLGIDSPKALRLLVRLEDHFGIEISDEAAGQMRSVRDVLDYVKSATA